jgi:hypothetical protein
VIIQSIQPHQGDGEEGYEVSNVNKRVKTCQIQLAKHRQTFPETDLVINLFKAYKAFPNKEFKDYIEQHSSNYEEGQPQTSEGLIELVDAKCCSLQLLERYEQVDETGSKLIAMQVSFLAMRAELDGYMSGQATPMPTVSAKERKAQKAKEAAAKK